jgi:hypothetical protein
VTTTRQTTRPPLAGNGQRDGLDAADPGIAFGEWAKERGYDAATRTYRKDGS